MLITFFPYRVILGFNQLGVDLQMSRDMKNISANLVNPMFDITLDWRCHPGADIVPTPYPRENKMRGRAQVAMLL